MKRDDLTVRAEKARQYFGNPEFRAAYDAVRNEIIAALETTVLNGSEEIERYVLELQRQLHLLTRMRAAGMRPIRDEKIEQMSQKKRRLRLG